MQDNYLSTIEELNKDFFKNYWEMEKIIVAKLAKDEQQYFIDNKCYDILGKFEPTIKAYCEIMEKLNEKPGWLLEFYMHLNDMENVKKHQELLKDDPLCFIYNDFQNYQDSGRILGNKLISIKFDHRITEFAEQLHDYANGAETFMKQEWVNLLPPKIRVILIDSEGWGPYNADLNEMYFPVQNRSVSRIAGDIVHETFHFINSYYIRKASSFKCSAEENSFKFMDEGYALLIDDKYSNKTEEHRIISDKYAKEIAVAGSFNFLDLKSKWVELFSAKEIIIYRLARSFVYFLQDKFGAEKLKNLFLPNSKIEEKSWLEYVENYFGRELDVLIEEWKQNLVKM